MNMTVSSTNADDYFTNHLFRDDWFNFVDKDRALSTAENMILGSYILQEDYADNPAYDHAVYEQALYIIQRDRERWKLQNEGISSYSVDDMSFKMENSLFSPIVRSFLNKVRLKTADIVSDRNRIYAKQHLLNRYGQIVNYGQRIDRP